MLPSTNGASVIPYRRLKLWLICKLRQLWILLVTETLVASVVV